MTALLADPTFLSLRWDAWQAIGVWFTGAVTAGLVLYAALQLRQSRQLKDEQSAEARELLDEQTRPYMIVDFHFRSIMISLAVKNIGRTPATDVRVILNERLESAVFPGTPWQDSPLFTDAVPLFAPGREMRFTLDLFDRRRDRDLPMRISGTIEYWRFGRRGQMIREPFDLDLTGFAESLLPPKDISDIGDEAEKIRKLLETRISNSN